MILKSKDSTEILITCACKCSGLQFLKFKWADNSRDYYIYHMINSFNREQITFWGRLKRKLKIIWQILTTGFYRYNEIYLTEEQFKELKEAIIEFE